jgi:RNA polymerase sigma factor (sigma-70 family)
MANGEWLAKAQEIATSSVRRYWARRTVAQGPEDLIQRLTIKLLDLPRRYPNADPESLLKLAWRAGLNFMRDHARGQDREVHHTRKYAAPVVTREYAKEQVEAADTAHYLRTHLPGPTREIFDLLLDGYNQVQIAEQLGRSTTGVNDHVFRIRRTARELGLFSESTLDHD